MSSTDARGAGGPSAQRREERSLDQQTFIALRRAHDAVMTPLAALLRQHGISEPQFNVLRILRGAGDDGLPCQAIAEQMITRLPDITRLLDRLEAAGHVRRLRSREDRRVVMVWLEPSGRELLARLDAPVDAVHARQFSSLSRRQLGELERLLGIVVAPRPPAPTEGGGPGSSPARRSR